MSDFRPGQVWQYTTRSGEENSRVIICNVEQDDNLGTIVHIHVEGVEIKSPKAPDGISRFVGHMPFSADALQESVVALESTRQSLPDYEEGYKTWKEAFDDGNAGVFTISIAEGVSFVEQALNQ